ncbi:MAG: addiction module protein [Dehalococcoidia bacterium]
MGKIEQIEQVVQTLSPEELAAFRRWFQAFDAEDWDRRIEADARSGKLDTLAEAALKAHRAGQSFPIGFDDLPINDQIEYVQFLWDRIAAHQQDIPVPEWHGHILEERLASYANAPDEGISWEEASDQLRKKLADLGR